MLKFINSIFVISLISSFYVTSRAANILAITALLSPSHHHFNDVYLFELVKRGHNVTVLVHDEDRHNHPNYTHIILEDVYPKVQEGVDFMIWNKMSSWELLNSFHLYMEITCALDLKTKGLKTIMAYPENYKFDLVVLDVGSGQCLFPLIERFGNLPIIGINPFLNQPNILKNVWQSYVPFMAHSLSSDMNVWQRAYSAFFKFAFDFLKYAYYDPRQKELAEGFFGKFDSTIEEVERKMSVILTNYNPMCNAIEALPPNLVPVGGLHIQVKTLPEDIKTILDKSVKGVILFSLGTNVDPNNFKPETLRAILSVFGKLPYTVFWKNKKPEELTGVPKNVHVRKWLPQNEILAHKNTVLFVSHCGLLSSQEIVYHGVPVIGIPFIIDQKQNIKNLESRGIGIPLYLDDITEETFNNAIQKILSTKSYRENAKKASRYTKFYLTNPLETAIKWTEFILENGPVKEFDMATRNMNVWQIANLDLYLILTIIAVIFITLKIIVIRCLVQCFRKKGTKKVKTN